MSNLFHLPKVVAVDSSGTPYASAKLEFFTTGTSSNANTYTDAALATPHTNPVVADSNGVFAPIYLDPDVTYKATLSQSDDTLIYTVDPVSDQLTQANIGLLMNPVVSGETSAGVTPTLYKYEAGEPYYDARRYGFATGNTATANSTALQAAVNVVEAAGGGTVYIPEGSYNTNAPIVVPAGVSLLGADPYGTIITKTTSTASSVSDDTVPVYQTPTTVGNPVCVFHFVEGLATGWSGRCKGIQVRGDTADPNTSAVVYGFFFRGMSHGRLENCIAQYTSGPGIFLGAASSIYSQIENCVVASCGRGLYVYSGTSMRIANCFMSKIRFIVYDISLYYSVLEGLASDFAGHADVRDAATDVTLVYHLYDCNGVTLHGCGCEVTDGGVIKAEGCASLTIDSFLGLDITSSHDNATSGLDTVCLDIDGTSHNVDIKLRNVRMVFASTKISGSAVAANHYNYKITGGTGALKREDVRFVDALNDVAEVGWSGGSYGGGSGTFVEDRDSGTFTPALSFATEGDMSPTYGGSNAGNYQVIGDLVFIQLDLHLTNLTFSSASGQLRITGLPFTVAGIDTGLEIAYVSDDIDYSTGRTALKAVAVAAQAYVILYEAGDAADSTAIAAANLVTANPLRIQVSGTYRRA